jgi:hypothetical protein
VRKMISVLFGALSILASVALGASAQDAILTVKDTAGGAADRTLTLAEIQAIGTTQIQTSTAWTDGPQTFEGVSGADLVKTLGVTATEVVASALNDYSVVIPFGDFNSDKLLLAYARNGEAMSVRDKGPLWIVFPFDDPAFSTDAYRTYAIWSLSKLEFR